MLARNSKIAGWLNANKYGPKLIHFIMQNESNMISLLPSYPTNFNNNYKSKELYIIVDIIGLLTN